LMGVNADKINLLNKDSKLKDIVNNCGIINADGASVVLASKYLGCPLSERVAGIDLMDKLVGLANDKGYSIYLIRAKEQDVKKTYLTIKMKYKNINICGYHNGYFNENEWDDIFVLLKQKKPQIVFVGITSPLKEYFVDYMQKKGLE